MNHFEDSYKKVAVIYLLVLVSITSGCVQNSPQVSTKEKIEPTSLQPETSTHGVDSGGEPQQLARIKINPGRLALSGYDFKNTPARIKVKIYITGYKVSYEHLRLCAYAESGQLLQEKMLGNTSVAEQEDFRERFTVKYTANTRPHYIIVDHPKLRNDSRFTTDVRIYTGDGYTLREGNLGSVQDRFTWPRTNQTGKCG